MVCTSILHLVNGVERLNVQRDCPTRQRRGKTLHVASQAQHKMQRAFLLDVVIQQFSCISLQSYTCPSTHAAKPRAAFSRYTFAEPQVPCPVIEREALTVIGTVRDCERSYQFWMLAYSSRKVQHIPRNGLVHFCQGLSVLLDCHYCFHEEVTLSCLLHSSLFRFCTMNLEMCVCMLPFGLPFDPSTSPLFFLHAAICFHNPVNKHRVEHAPLLRHLPLDLHGFYFRLHFRPNEAVQSSLSAFRALSLRGQDILLCLCSCVRLKFVTGTCKKL